MENFLEIVRGAYQGEVVLPEFHHPFVWGRKDIEELLASVLQECFVGTFLMVDTSPGKPLFLFRLVEGLAQVNGQANPKQHSTVRLVLDGRALGRCEGRLLDTKAVPSPSLYLGTPASHLHAIT